MTPGHFWCKVFSSDGDQKENKREEKKRKEKNYLWVLG